MAPMREDGQKRGQTEMPIVEKDAHVASPTQTKAVTRKYIAEIEGGREVTLIGAADYNYWKDMLAGTYLVPFRVENRAEVWLSAVELKWMGVRFSEVSVSIFVHETHDPQNTGVYLFTAFNTSRVFSFIERHWFHTPYHHAQVRVDTRAPWAIELTDDADIVLGARRYGTTAPQETDSTWEGAIYLPSRQAMPEARREVFFARLSGATEIAPFDASCDLVQIRPSKRHSVLQALIDSHFSGIEWRLRANASHARSKTYKRERML